MATKAAVPATNGVSPASGIVIPGIKIETIEIEIIGDSPLIMHAWSEKAKDMMRGTHEKRPKGPREKRDSDREFQDAAYRLPDGRYAFPALAFKAAAIDAASQVTGLTKVFLRGTFHTVHEYTVLECEEPIKREDTVRVGMGSADLRYRPEFPVWSTWLRVRYNTGSISLAQLLDLFNLGGFASGIGEWRPQKDGHNGMFHVGGYRIIGREGSR